MSGEISILTSEEFDQLIASHSLAAIHFDAVWDLHRKTTRAKMLEAKQAFGDQVAIGEIDCDRYADVARTIPVKNVPLVAYYRNGQLVEAVVGANQDVRSRIKRLLDGKQ